MPIARRLPIICILAALVAFVAIKLVLRVVGDPLTPGTRAFVRPATYNPFGSGRMATLFAENGDHQRLHEGTEIRVLRGEGPTAAGATSVATAGRVKIKVVRGAKRGRTGYVSRDDLSLDPP